MKVSDAARWAERDPETIRRWIRSGRLRATKTGTHYVVEESDLDALPDEEAEMLPAPAGWESSATGHPLPNVGAAIRHSRRGR